MPGLQPRDRPNQVAKTSTTPALEGAGWEEIGNRIRLIKLKAHSLLGLAGLGGGYLALAG